MNILYCRNNISQESIIKAGVGKRPARVWWTLKVSKIQLSSNDCTQHARLWEGEEKTVKATVWIKLNFKCEAVWLEQNHRHANVELHLLEESTAQEPPVTAQIIWTPNHTWPVTCSFFFLSKIQHVKKACLIWQIFVFKGNNYFNQHDRSQPKYQETSFVWLETTARGRDPSRPGCSRNWNSQEHQVTAHHCLNISGCHMRQEAFLFDWHSRG